MERSLKLHICIGKVQQIDRIFSFSTSKSFFPQKIFESFISTKSGSRRIFNAAGVDTPPGDYDIYNIQQLTESLGRVKNS